jgi:hypothetical protein
VVFTGLKIYKDSSLSSTKIADTHLELLEQQDRIDHRTRAILDDFIANQRGGIFDFHADVAADVASREGVLMERAIRSCTQQLAIIDARQRMTNRLFRPADICIAIMYYPELTDGQIKEFFTEKGEWRQAEGAQPSELRRKIASTLEAMSRALCKSKEPNQQKS